MKVKGTLLFYSERLALELLEAVFPDFEFEIRIGKTENSLEIRAISSSQTIFFEGQFFQIYSEIFKKLYKTKTTEKD